MARNAQNEADLALLKAGGDAAKALLDFDTRFAAIYLGRFTSFSGTPGEGRPMRTFDDVLHYSIPGGTRSRIASGDLLGQSDFAREFYETSPRGDREDQTHHFAAYFSLGINNRPLSEWSAETLDRSGGEPDRLLGAQSYIIGEDLRRDPSRLRSIGDRIRGEICR
jgi:hypothetical protein